MAEFDTIIRRGTLVDGAPMPRYRADGGIKDGKIAKRGYLKAHQANRVVEADGHYVAPGFGDLHTRRADHGLAALRSLSQGEIPRDHTLCDIHDFAYFTLPDSVVDALPLFDP